MDFFRNLFSGKKYGVDEAWREIRSNPKYASLVPPFLRKDFEILFRQDVKNKIAFTGRKFDKKEIDYIATRSVVKLYSGDYISLTYKGMKKYVEMFKNLDDSFAKQLDTLIYSFSKSVRAEKERGKPFSLRKRVMSVRKKISKDVTRYSDFFNMRKGFSTQIKDLVRNELHLRRETVMILDKFFDNKITSIEVLDFLHKQRKKVRRFF